MPRCFPNLLSGIRKHFLLILSGLLLLGVGGGIAGMYAWASYHFHAAEEALGRRDFVQAQQHLNQCLKVWPNNVAVHLLAVQAARRRDAYAEAELHLSACERLGGVSWETSLERALLQVQQGNLDDSAALQQALSSPPGSDPAKDALILEALAQGYLKDYYPLEALQVLNLLLQQQPGHVQALCWRGRAWENLEHPEKARADYQRAVDLAPAFAEARLHLATVLYQVGEVWEAACHYENLRQRQPEASEVLLGLARCRDDLHELAAGRQLLDTILAGHPDDKSALLERGGLALRSGQPAEAEPWLRRAASLAPYNLQVHRTLYHCQLALGKAADARHTLARVAEIERETVRVDRLIARSVESDANAALLQEIGTSLIRLDRDQEGLPRLFAALKIDPHYRPAHAALADYFQRHGQEDRAARYRLLATAEETIP